MTNREWWEREIRKLPDSDFAAMICGQTLSDGSEMQIRFGDRLCAWCEATHGGVCQSAEDSDCVVTDEDYLRGEVIEE